MFTKYRAQKSYETAFKTTDRKTFLPWPDIMSLCSLGGSGSSSSSRMQKKVGKKEISEEQNDMKNEYKSNIFMRVLIPNVRIYSYEICGIEIFFLIQPILLSSCAFFSRSRSVPIFSIHLLMLLSWRPHKYKLRSHVHIMIHNCCCLRPPLPFACRFLCAAEIKANIQRHLN